MNRLPLFGSTPSGPGLPALAALPSSGAAPGSSLAGRRVALVHLGCAKNLVDSEHMLARLAEEGAALTGDADGADVLVLNTCAFIGDAKRESIDRILEAERWKAERAGRRIVVAGCLAERYPGELRSEIPAIDALVGTGQVLEVARAAAGAELDAPGGKLPEWLADAGTRRVLTTATHTAYIKIAEGCDHVCSFCIIPTLRGKQRSRPVEDVVAEARALVDMGVKEVNLVAQDSTSYGEDRGERDGLAHLLRALGHVDGLAWVRVHYAYPTRLSDAFLAAVGETANVCKYLDMPLQHASRPVLKAMLRGGDPESQLRLLERVRASVPGITVRTTFIVGFPSETERRFEELCGFVRQADLDRAGAFTYSHEDGTTAHALRDRVPAAEKERRKRALLAIQRRVSSRKLRALVGRQVPVLVDGVDPGRGIALARLEGQAPEVDGSVRVTGCDPDLEPGDLIDVRIAGASAHDLRAVPAGHGDRAGLGRA